MRFSALPDDVQSLILRASLSEKDDPGHFKDNLPLAAVCRRWRCFVLPIICSDMHVWYDDEYMFVDSISCGSSSPDDEWLDINLSDDDLSDGHLAECFPEYDSSNDDKKVKTNLGLIASAGCVGFVRHVRVEVSLTYGYIDAFKATVKLMRNVANTWPGVNTFNLSADLEGRPNRWAKAKYYKKEMIYVSRVLASLIPGVRRLSLDSDINVGIVRSGFQELARCYVGQLEHLHCNHLDFLPPNCQFKQLMEADVDCSYIEDPLLLRVDRTRLAKLDLTNIPPSLLWAGFDPDSGPQIIELPALRSLQLSYCDTTMASSVTRSAQSWKLHLPQLQTLDTSCDSVVCPVLVSAVFPARMVKLSISVTAGMLRHIADMALPAAWKLVLTVIDIPGNYPRAAGHVNRILSGAHQGEEMQLIIRNNSLRVLPRTVIYTGLTHLAIETEIEPRKLLDLLRKLPRLTDLVAQTCVLDDTHDFNTTFKPSKNKLIKPLNTKVQRLTIGFKPDNKPELAVIVVRYLILRLPSLTRLALPEEHKEPIISTISELSTWHPRLLDIKFSFELLLSYFELWGR